MTEARLTQSEERVARLVARGRTNAEIAKALGLQPRTVAAHLTHTYRKLGVRSRTELALLTADGSWPGLRSTSKSKRGIE